MCRFLITVCLALFAATPLSAQALVAPDAQRTTGLSLSARLAKDGKTLRDGLIWRVFDARPGEDGQHRLIATAKGGPARFDLPGGDYLIHAAFGRAGATTRLTVGGEPVEQTLTLSAGGLQLSAVSGGEPIRPRLLRFSIYEQTQDEDGNRKLIALNVGAGKVLRLNEGTYHVLSRYGTTNATVRADLQVSAGRLTRATLQHRGAEVSLRLVSRPGGDPIASTSWTVLTADGQPVFSSSSLAPMLVLAEGEYEAVATNAGRVHRQSFTVNPGPAIRIEVKLGS